MGFYLMTDHENLFEYTVKQQVHLLGDATNLPSLIFAL